MSVGGRGERQPEGGHGAEPRATLAIVVGSNGARGSVQRCLEAIEPQRDGVEVLVCEPQASAEQVQVRYPWATFIERRDALIPELWRDGIERTSAEVIALTISPMIPASDWVVAIRAELRNADVIAGAIDPGPGLRVSDFAEYLCRYAKDMRPFEPHPSIDLPGDNSAYRRAVLVEARETYADGFWEPVVNRALADRGARLFHTPVPVVYQGRSAGWAAFTRQRLRHGEAHGRQRGERFSPARNVLGVLGAPAVPVLLTARILREVSSRGPLGLRTLLALPHVLLFNIAWAVGEARGHLHALRES
ncbi:MAG TPA: hypothetical protein VJT68_09285 [Thermoleophilaceae bacterium]|nr:hypothetical protein [Thermoleophilaceae bacterium]